MKLYGNPCCRLQVTGNSNSMRAFWKPLRQAGATARAMLVAGRGARWNVDRGELPHAGRRSHPRRDAAARSTTASCRRRRRMQRRQGRAAEGAEGLPLDRHAAEAAGHAGQGQRQGRLRHRCAPAGREVRDAGASPGARRQGGARRRYARRKAVQGVRQVVVLDDRVAVVADHMWAAKQGLAALTIDWDEGPNGELRRTRSGQRAARREQARRRGRQERGRCRRQAGRARRHELEATTSCRSSRTPAWSR